MRNRPEPKPAFIERMKELLPKEQDFEKYLEVIQTDPVDSIRCNTLKISPEELKKRLEKKNWIVEQPFKDHKEIMIIHGKYSGTDKIDLGPGEIGRSMEHLLGYYYVQEIASMLPVLTLQPNKDETVLDLCASPGSKTTQMVAMMHNQGLLVANEVSIGRVKILASNLERCGATNVIITRKDGIAICKKFKQQDTHFDKILVDAPCSGEGTLRSSAATARMWNPKAIIGLSRLQKALVCTAIEILKVGGELVYSTCTHAPEENEAVLDFAIKEFGNRIAVEKISLPINCRPGLGEWEGESYDSAVTKSCRVYPQDNNTEGFFISKIRRVK